MSLLNIRKDNFQLDFVSPGSLIHRLDPGVVPFRKALLMGIEFSILVAVYEYLVKLIRMPVFVALSAAIVISKLAYYTMKFAALGTGILSGNLVSTPFQTQLILAAGTATVFALIERYRSRNPETRSY